MILEYRRETADHRMDIVNSLANDPTVVGSVDFDDSELMFAIEEAIRNELDLEAELYEVNNSSDWLDNSFDGDCEGNADFVVCPACK